MEKEYELKDLELLEEREDGESDYIEAYSGLGDLRVREQEEEVCFTWKSSSGFSEVLEAVERNYRIENGVQVLEKDETGDINHGKVRDYVTEGPLDGDDLGEWSSYRLIQVGGSDFYVSWSQREQGGENRIRLVTSGSGLDPFAAVYTETVDEEGTEEVLEDIEDEFFDKPRTFPGFWDPRDRYD